MIDKISKLLAEPPRVRQRLCSLSGLPTKRGPAGVSAAQRLATVYQISLADARLHTSSGHRRETPVSERVTIGKPGKRINVRLRNLLGVIANANDVTALFSRSITHVVELVGMPTDMDITKAAFAQASVTMIRLSEEYLDTSDVWKTRSSPSVSAWFDAMCAAAGSDNALDYDGPEGEIPTCEVPVNRSSARTDYMTGFTTALSQHLDQTRAEVVAEAEAAQEASATRGTTALALRDKATRSPARYGNCTPEHGRVGVTTVNSCPRPRTSKGDVTAPHTGQHMDHCPARVGRSSHEHLPVRPAQVSGVRLGGLRSRRLEPRIAGALARHHPVPGHRP